MSDKTGISWTDATWNPVRGCSRVSEGCRNCYAEQQAARIVRMAKGKPSPYDGLVSVRSVVSGLRYTDVKAAGSYDQPRWTGIVRIVAEHLADPLRWKRPRRIFVNSMSDLFHESLSNEDIAAVFGVMAAAPQHTFQVLTKRAKRMREWFAWAAGSFTEQQRGIAAAPHTFRAMLDAAYEVLGKPAKPILDKAWHLHQDNLWPLPNVWLGVSVENQDAADERIPELLETPAAVRFLSCEPLLEHVTLAGEHDDSWLRRLHWVIAGCESGPGARPCDIAWLRSLRDQCATAGLSFFLKQAQETRVGICGDSENPNGHEPCGKPIEVYVYGPGTASYFCDCCVEGPEDGAHVELGFGEGSKRKQRGVIELPYLDGVQHAAFPETRS